MRRRRSLLFVCGDDPGALAAARGAGADSLILDLEDTVPPERKLGAQRQIDASLRAGASAEQAVRVNGVATPWTSARSWPPGRRRC